MSYDPNLYAPPMLAAGAAREVPPPKAMHTRKESGVVERVRRVLSEDTLVEQAANKHAEQQLAKDPGLLTRLQSKFPEMAQNLAMGGAVELDKAIMNRDRGTAMHQCGLGTELPGGQPFDHVPLPNTLVSCMLGATDLEAAFESSEIDTNDTKETVGHFADPLSGEVYEMQMDLPPASDGDYHVNRDNVRFEMLRGRPSPNVSAKTEVTEAPPPGHPQMGEAEFKQDVIDRETSYGRAQTYWNRDNEQEAAEMDRYPVGYTGQQDTTPNQNRIFYLAPTQRGVGGGTGELRTNVPEDRPNGEDTEGGARRRARVRGSLRRNGRVETAAPARAAPDARNTVDQQAAAGVGRVSNRNSSQAIERVGGAHQANRAAVVRQAASRTGQDSAANLRVNKATTLEGVGASAAASMDRTGPMTLPLTAAGFSQLELPSSGPVHGHSQLSKRQEAAGGQHRLVRSAVVAGVVQGQIADRHIEERSAAPRLTITHGPAAAPLAAKAARVLASRETTAMPLTGRAQSCMLHAPVVGAGAGERGRAEVVAPQRVNLPDLGPHGTVSADKGLVGVHRTDDQAAVGNGRGIDAGAAANGVVRQQQAVAKPEVFGVQTGAVASAELIGKRWDPSPPVAPKAKGGKTLHHRGALLPQRLNPARRGAETRPDAVFQNHNDRRHAFRDVDLKSQRRVQGAVPVSNNLPRMVTPVNSVPSTPVR